MLLLSYKLVLDNECKNLDNYLAPVLETLIVCQQIDLCTFVAVLKFTMILADIQRPNLNSEQGPRSGDIQLLSLPPLVFYSNYQINTTQIITHRIITRGWGLSITFWGRCPQRLEAKSLLYHITNRIINLLCFDVL